jgi:hypothetical protein
MSVLNSNYTIPTFKFKRHFIRVQIQRTRLKYFSLTFHLGHKKWKPSFINENINIYISQFIGQPRPLISKIKINKINSSTTFSWFQLFPPTSVYTIIDRWTNIGYFTVELIKERVRNTLKIEHTGSSEIELGTYLIILVCLLDLQQLSMQLIPSILLLMQWLELVFLTALSSFEATE